MSDHWEWVNAGNEGVTQLDSLQVGNFKCLVGPTFAWINGKYSQVGMTSNVIRPGILTPRIDNPERGLNVEKALTLAKLSNLAYSEYAEVKEELTHEHYKLKARFEIKSNGLLSNIHGFIASNTTTMVVAFRGTKISSPSNIITDLKALPTKEFLDSIHCHRGFVGAYNSIKEDVTKYVKEQIGQRRLIITGHSLGGAVASLFTYDISNKLKNIKLEMYVYGCPIVCKDPFPEYFSRLSSYAVIVEGDAVPTFRIPLSGLKKPMNEYYLLKAYDGIGSGIQNHEIDTYIKQLEKA